MRRVLSVFSTAVLTAALLVSAATPASASRLVSSFDTGLGGLVAIAVDANSIFVYAAFDDTIDEFSKTGVAGTTLPRPGFSSNDFDLDIPPNGVTIGSGNVPAGGLLVTNGESSPQQIFGMDRAGAISGHLDLPAANYVGGSYHPTRDSSFLVDYGADVIREWNTAGSGTLLNEFPVHPAGSPDFDVFFGDVAVGTNGNLYIVSSTQDFVREMSPTGGFIRDWSVSGLLPPNTMSGIDIDPGTGNAWIAINSAGVVYEIALEPSAADRVGCAAGDTCGTGGDDNLSANDGTIQGGAGDDTIEGIIDETTTELIVEAGPGNDEITLNIQDATQTVTVRVVGGGGADVISVPRSPGALTPNLLAGDGNDVIKVVASPSPRVPYAQGSPPGRYVIDSGGGNDRVTSGTSADRIKSAAGNDTVDGGAGNDQVDAGGGGDDLEGGTGNDALGGGGGNDVIHGGDGANNFAGGSGSDTCLSDTRKDRFSGCERIRRNHRRNHGQL